jgi:hypothetical protein
MQNDDDFKEKNSGFSLSHSHPGHASRNKYVAALFLGLSLFSLFACNGIPNCSSGSLSSACAALPNPTAAAHPPAKTPAAPPPPPPPGSNDKEGKNLSKTVTSIPTLSDDQLVLNDVKSYDGLVLDGSVSAYHKAYNKLDVSLRSQEPYDDFVTNSNFTLGKGCWQDHLDQIVLTQIDRSTWIAALPMTKVTCVDKTLLGQYIWNLKVQLVYSLTEIVEVALQPNS